MTNRHKLQRLPAFPFLQCCGLATFLLLCAGCTTMRQTFSGDPVARQTEVKERLALIFNAAETRDLDRLDSYHWYGPHFTKFTSSARNRLDAAAARLPALEVNLVKC